MTRSLLMCAPEFFGVHYSINPWMNGKAGKVDLRRAGQQWQDYYFLLQRFARVHLITPQPEIPDLVFTANAGLILGNKFIPSSFRFAERRLEEPFFLEWFQSRGYQVATWPDSIPFEGAGDALVQPGRNLLWAGYGFRTDFSAHAILKNDFQMQVISLRLVDPMFYHLDTCFCPLQDGGVMYFPPAFSAESLKRIEDHTIPENRIMVSEEDAIHFSCNAVLLDKNIILSHASRKLCNQLENAGYAVHICPMTEFLKAGGANKCLTLELEPNLENEKRDTENNTTPMAARP